MSDEVRFGILGLGVGSSRAKIAANTPGARLVCVCDLQEEKVKVKSLTHYVLYRFRFEIFLPGRVRLRRTLNLGRACSDLSESLALPKMGTSNPKSALRITFH